MSISEIVKKYLEEMTLREFADEIGVRSHATIINWRDGRSEPETDLLMRLKELGDWRGEFARACLKIRFGG